MFCSSPEVPQFAKEPEKRIPGIVGSELDIPCQASGEFDIILQDIYFSNKFLLTDPLRIHFQYISLAANDVELSVLFPDFFLLRAFLVTEQIFKRIHR